MLPPSLGLPTQEASGPFEAGPEQGPEDDQSAGVSLLWGQAERAVAVQLWVHPTAACQLKGQESRRGTVYGHGVIAHRVMALN